MEKLIMKAFLQGFISWIKGTGSWVLAGMLGGWICGSVILSFGGLIGKSGDTGCEYVGYWSPAYLGLSLFYGVPLGVLSLVMMRFIFWKLESSFPWKNAKTLAAATIIGGMIGCFSNYFLAVLFGEIFFITAFGLVTARSFRSK